MPHYRLLPSFLLVLAAVLTACSGEKNYENRISKTRMEKDQHFKYADPSPLTNDQKEDFESLNYFPVNKQFRVTAEVERLSGNDTFTMAYKNGKDRRYIRYAKLSFNLKGQDCELYAYRNVDPDQKGGENPLFIPFYDETNGTKTYGGGRYLDIKTEKLSDTLKLDFNKAYNPYCAYNERYACPIPPKENKLAIGIPAGEKDFEQ